MKQKKFKNESKAPRKISPNTVEFCLSSEQNLPNVRPFFMDVINF
jgi:hypothetical protein